MFLDTEVTATQPYDDHITDQRTYFLVKLRAIYKPYLHSSLNLLLPGPVSENIQAFKNLSGSISCRGLLLISCTLTLKAKILLQTDALKAWAFTKSAFTL
jgi:hypothetical protein